MSSILNGEAARARLVNLYRARNIFIGDGFYLGASHFEQQVLRTFSGRRDERDIYLSLNCGREFDLGLFCRFVQALERELVAADIDAGSLLEFVSYPVDDLVVDIAASEVTVAVGRLHFDDIVADLEHGHVKRSASEVVHDYFLILSLVKSVSERSCRRLVDDALHVEGRR